MQAGLRSSLDRSIEGAVRHQMDILQTYQYTIYAMGAMSLLLLLQLLVADVVGIRSKHTPGAAVAADHDDLLFRASRTVANTNESIK